MRRPRFRRVYHGILVFQLSGRQLTALSIASVSATIDQTAKTAAVTVPYGTDVTELAPTYTITGESVKIGNKKIVSGTTKVDWTNPVKMKVYDVNGNFDTYTVTVTVAPNTASSLTAFAIGEAEGTITDTAVAVEVPHGTEVTALVATFALSAGASAKVGTTAQVSGTTANDFTDPVDYIVTAEDGTHSTTYTVTVTVAAE